MRAWTKVLVGIGLIAALAVPVAASEDLGQFCWKLSPYVDVLQLSVTQSSGPGAIFEIHGLVKANATAGQNAAGGAGPAAYQMLGAGTAASTIGQANSIDAALQASHNTTFFGGNVGCNFYGVINAFFLGGTWKLECPGTTPYKANGTLTFLGACPAL